MNSLKYRACLVITALLMTININSAVGQHIHMGLFVDPLISWYSSDSRDVEGRGTRAGIAGGFNINFYFSQNYAFSSGVTLLRSGGIQSYSDTTLYTIDGRAITVDQGSRVNYRGDYVMVPLGLRLRTNQIGYFSIFSDFGISPFMRTKGVLSIPSADISNEPATGEFNRFGAGYHIQGGVEYSLGGTTHIIVGLGYDNSLTDITSNNPGQTGNRSVQRMLRFRAGLIF